MVRFLCITDCTEHTILLPFNRNCWFPGHCSSVKNPTFERMEHVGLGWEQICEVLVKLLHGISSRHFDNEVLGIANRVTSFSFLFPLKYVDLQPGTAHLPTIFTEIMVRLLSRNTRKWPPKVLFESQRLITRWR